jgi:hypothetical protein
VESDERDIEVHQYVNKLTMSVEDESYDPQLAQDKRDAVVELYDRLFDINFMKGITTQRGDVLKESYLSFLKDAIPADRTIDASSLNLDRAANLFLKEAYDKVSGELVQDNWGTLVLKQEAMAELNKLEAGDNDFRVREQIQASNAGVGGVENILVLPDQIALEGPDGQDTEVPIDDMGKDEALLLPSSAGEEFVSLYESTTPMVRGPIEQEGFVDSYEYMAAQGFGFAQDRHSDATDAIHIVNFSSVF